MDFGIIGGLGSLAGSIINGISNAVTNETNQRIASRTNASNERINEAQLAAQRENWKREQENFLLQREWQLADREYNTPEAMKQRYLNAGINPYLAMYGGAGMQGEAREGSPSAPSFSAPGSPIPMQTGAAMQPLNFDFGLGISRFAEMYYRDKAEERADYALANDITVSRQNAYTNWINALTEAKKSGVEQEKIDTANKQWERNFWFENDKFKHQLEMDEFQIDLANQTYQLKVDELEVQKEQNSINKMLARAQIAVSDATAKYLAQQKVALVAQVQEMRKNGLSQRQINRFVSQKEKELLEQIKRDNARAARNDIPGIRQAYTDFTEWLFSPIKGIISIK